MLEVLNHLFAAVCGQNPEHTWAPGGVLLPCCQRCLGLYAGVGVAALLHVWLKPRLTARFLEIHGLFLLLMAPFGFHWLPQGPVLRTVTGLLFGFAITTFFWAPMSRKPAGPSAAYAIVLALAVALLPIVAESGGQATAYCLSGMALAGAAALGALVLGNVGLCVAGVLRLLRRLAFDRAEA